MRVRVIHGIDELEADCKHIARTARKDMRGVVVEGIRVGNSLARDFAKVSAGEHGVHYHKAFTTEMGKGFSGFGTSIISGEYGPRIDKPQGGMSFESGSRNQPPHNDLAKSLDEVAPAFQGEVRRLPDRWFWPAQ